VCINGAASAALICTGMVSTKVRLPCRSCIDTGQRHHCRDVTEVAAAWCSTRRYNAASGRGSDCAVLVADMTSTFGAPPFGLAPSGVTGLFFSTCSVLRRCIFYTSGKLYASDPVVFSWRGLDVKAVWLRRLVSYVPRRGLQRQSINRFGGPRWRVCSHCGSGGNTTVLIAR
jgi:hypothetical protein